MLVYNVLPEYSPGPVYERHYSGHATRHRGYMRGGHMRGAHMHGGHMHGGYRRPFEDGNGHDNGYYCSCGEPQNCDGEDIIF